MNHSATYSPEDDKIRISPACRLPEDEYKRVKAAGYRWAPMQKVFYAVWSPAAEDVALEMCGEIDDEDKSLIERAEERAERFETYSENRAEDSKRAHAAVSAIADNIPLGQPIRVGHHSERHARKDAERIQNGMRKAVDMWKQSEYWRNRAADAIRHAKYKERPDVRGRRIKTLEAELRKCIAAYTPLTTKERPEPQYIMQQDWHKCYPTHGPSLTSEERDAIPEELHVWVGPPGRGGQWKPVADLPAIKAYYARLEEHLSNRLEYEAAMLKNDIGVDDHRTRFDLQVGGKVFSRGTWLTILKLNKKDGVVVSVSTNSTRWTRVVPVEEIQEYQAPEEGAAETIKAATKRPPLCNYPGKGFASCTSAEWKKVGKDYKSTIHRIEATETHAAHCVRWAIGVYLNRPPMPDGLDSYKQSQWKMNERHNYYPVYITDEKRKDPPALNPDEPPPTVPAPERIAPQPRYTPEVKEPAPFDVEAMQETLKAGIQVVSAPQLFPTPAELAEQVMEYADIESSHTVLEPSAGTGALIDAIPHSPYVVAVEINNALCRRLNTMPGVSRTVEADFLGCNPDHVGLETLGYFDRIVMNPPFENGTDIKHIRHAMTFLKPGGRLVAICANGPRQQDKLKPLASSWEELPEGTFKDQGTMVRCALMVYNAPKQDAPQLAENPEEAQRRAVAGRSWPALKESKCFDSERLAESPLFERKLF